MSISFVEACSLLPDPAGAQPTDAGSQSPAQSVKRDAGMATTTHHNQWDIEARVVVGHHAEQPAATAAATLATE